MIITGLEIDALSNLILYGFLSSIFFGLFVGSILHFLFRTVMRRIKFPNKVKTQDGYLYRTNSGAYVKKDLVQQTNSDFKLKKRDFWIKHHQRQIDFLSKS